MVLRQEIFLCTTGFSKIQPCKILTSPNKWGFTLSIGVFYGHLHSNVLFIKAQMNLTLFSAGV